MYESNESEEMNSLSNTSSDNSIPDFLKSEKIDDALKNVFRQELQIYIHNQETKPEQTSILGFPSLLSPRSRFMLHTVTSTEFPALLTFSIGEESNRRCYIISREIFNPNSRESYEDGNFNFQSLNDVETAAGCCLDALDILTDPTVLQKIQSGCDTAVDQAVNLSHVVELYDFPSTIKTSDLDDVLHQLKLEKYYELIWVDDTHAFAVMSDNEAAQKVLQIEHSVVKLRPFSDASPQSRDKAKMLGLYGVDVYKKRPKTSMVTANRMLNRALGIKGERDKNKGFPDNNITIETTEVGDSQSVPHDSIANTRSQLQTHNTNASIAANRMLNRALGIKSDSKLKPRTRTNEQRHTNTCDNYQEEKTFNEVSDKRTASVRQNRNNYDPNLAANRMFKRALGSSVSSKHVSKEGNTQNNE